MPELALDDGQRGPFTGELDSVRMAQLVGRKPPPHPRLGGETLELRAGAAR